MPLGAVLPASSRLLVYLAKVVRISVFLVNMVLSCLDTTSFVPHLVERRDRGFHVYRQISLYLFKLGRRCIKPKSLPQESGLAGILSVSSSDARALAITAFIARSKLGQRLDVACKIKAERELTEKSGNKASLPKLVKEHKDA